MCSTHIHKFWHSARQDLGLRSIETKVFQLRTFWTENTVLVKSIYGNHVTEYSWANFRGCDLQFFDLTTVQKEYLLSKNRALNFQFVSFPGLLICNVILAGALGSGSHRSSPSAMWPPCWTASSLGPSCTLHVTILLFTFSTIFSKLCECVSTFLKNRLCARWFCPTVG